jgi:uncharacterized alpha-E superfamily protein
MLLSRVASACFWLSRYRERAEFTARVIDVHLVSQLDTQIADSEGDWEPIAHINGCYNLIADAKKPFNTPTVLNTLCLDYANLNSILSCIRVSRENARQAREQISSEMWEQINDMYHELGSMTQEKLVSNPHQLLQSIKDGTLLFQGLSDQTMMHGEAWQFIQLGRYIERANTTCRLLAVRSDPDLEQNRGYREAVYWIAVLKSASSLEAYHKTYTTPITSSAAIEFLLLNAESPRSILYCLEHTLRSMNSISGSTGRRFNNEADRILGQMSSRLHYLRLEEMDLASLLEEIQSCLYNATNFITDTYFAYEVA